MGFTVLSGLNDYIEPSQNCIKPVGGIGKGTSGAASLEVKRDDEPTPASISLSDCLACSGCITSAESVLVEMQSYQEVLSKLESISISGEQILTCFSISSQSITSIASKYNLSFLQAFYKIRWFLINVLNVNKVYGLEMANELSLIESGKEFITRFNQKRTPMLSSSCPGWICYAEKVHGKILHLIDSTKSSQLIFGSFLKNHIGNKMVFMPDKVYHVTGLGF
jgi:iron only hydrogenase large subunit-like protein